MTHIVKYPKLMIYNLKIVIIIKRGGPVAGHDRYDPRAWRFTAKPDINQFPCSLVLLYRYYGVANFPKITLKLSLKLY